MVSILKRIQTVQPVCNQGEKPEERIDCVEETNGMGRRGKRWERKFGEKERWS